MSTKECPSCGAEVPASATRCKECFHDFTEQPKAGQSWIGPLIVLGTVALMAVGAAVVLSLVFLSPVEMRTLVDGETRSVITTTVYRTGVTTDRLMFDDIVKVEHTAYGGTFQVVAITRDGERVVIAEGPSPRDSEGRKYAQIMDKPFEDVDPSVAAGRGR